MVLPARGCELYVSQHFGAASPLTDGKCELSAFYQVPPPVPIPPGSLWGIICPHHLGPFWTHRPLPRGNLGSLRPCHRLPSDLHIHPRPPAPSILHVPFPGAWRPAEVLTLRGLQGPGVGRGPPLSSQTYATVVPSSFPAQKGHFSVLHLLTWDCTHHCVLVSLLAPRNTLPSWLLLLGLPVPSSAKHLGGIPTGTPVSTCD